MHPTVSVTPSGAEVLSTAQRGLGSRHVEAYRASPGGLPIVVTTVTFEKPKVPKVHPFLGFGAQLNANIFSKTGGFVVKIPWGRPDQAQNLGPGQVEKLQDAINGLKPGHCRIFVPRGLDPDSPEGRKAPEFVALMNTIELAQKADANVNLTWWGQGPYAAEAKLAALTWPPAAHTFPPELMEPAHLHALHRPKETVELFARIIRAAREEFDCVIHATVSERAQRREYRHCAEGSSGSRDAVLRAAASPLRHRARETDRPAETCANAAGGNHIVAGDLLDQGKGTSGADGQTPWIKFMHANMDGLHGAPSLVDAYSIHVYWEPTEFPTKPRQRLKTLADTITNLPSERPVYVTEYGVRHLEKIENRRPGSLDGVKDGALAGGCLPARVVHREGAAVRMRRPRQMGPLPHRPHDGMG